MSSLIDNLMRIMQMKSSLSEQPSKENCNTIPYDTSDVTEIVAQSGIGKKKYRIAISGYSFEQEGYADTTSKFLKYLDKYLGSRNTGYITPPSLYLGSIYDITTAISSFKPENVALFTTKRYWEGTDLNSFNKDVNMRKFMKAPIYLFPDNQTYLEATANASNVLVCTGGKKVALNEIVEALKRNHKVIMLVNKNLKNDDFDKNNNSVECAPRYFNNYIINCGEDPANVKNLDLKFLNENQGKILHLVKWYFVDDEESIRSAAFRASQAMKAPSIYELIENNPCMNKAEKDNASQKFDTQVGEAFIRAKSTRI